MTRNQLETKLHKAGIGWLSITPYENSWLVETTQLSITQDFAETKLKRKGLILVDWMNEGRQIVVTGAKS